MTNKEIDNFILRYGGTNINFYINKSKKNGKDNPVAAAIYMGQDKNNKDYYVLNLRKKDFHNKNAPKSYLKALLLHEIGHIKMNHFKRKISNPNAELEAQMWAMAICTKYNFTKIKCYSVLIFLGWKDFIHRKKDIRYYYYAYRKFYNILGKQEIEKWKQLIVKKLHYDLS